MHSGNLRTCYDLLYKSYLLQVAGNTIYSCQNSYLKHLNLFKPNFAIIKYLDWFLHNCNTKPKEVK